MALPRVPVANSVNQVPLDESASTSGTSFGMRGSAFASPTYRITGCIDSLSGPAIFRSSRALLLSSARGTVAISKVKPLSTRLTVSDSPRAFFLATSSNTTVSTRAPTTAATILRIRINYFLTRAPRS
ncbi:hypothetical protein C3F09_08340 [candidate division GN15 bacterium]|uniref:Uncharacterized protein n=1 Tax=candidate division GN15 bacterium TaxID=2072418 RepID=A0A855WZ48_9BACT|nr:MAG: hypothetical protein C3F09_08340 [candidate division GN15 bacterium]